MAARKPKACRTCGEQVSAGRIYCSAECRNPVSPTGPNRTAADLTVQALRDRDSIEPEHEALVALVLSDASALDAEPGKADLAREYRQAVVALMEATSGSSDDDAKAFLLTIQTPRR